MRTVLRREFHGLYLIVVVFTLIELGHDMAEGASFAASVAGNFAWPAFFWVGTLVYILLMFLKKRTRLLQADGR